jgi:hypothetical protein
LNLPKPHVEFTSLNTLGLFMLEQAAGDRPFSWFTILKPQSAITSASFDMSSRKMEM